MRYNIVKEKDLEQAARSLSTYFEQQTVTLAVTLAELRGESRGAVSRKVVELSAEGMELARGIEPPTCGLQNRCSAIELRQPECIGLQTHPTLVSENLTTAYEAVKRTRGVTGSLLRHLGHNRNQLCIQVYLISHSAVLERTSY